MLLHWFWERRRWYSEVALKAAFGLGLRVGCTRDSTYLRIALTFLWFTIGRRSR